MSRLTLTIRVLLVVGSALLGLGLVAPCMTIQPSVSQSLDSWVRLLRPDELEPTTYSILGGILELIRTDSLGLGLILILFSVGFPAVKLATLWWGVTVVSGGRPGGAALWLTHHAGKFSMVDVMVIALLVIAIKGLPGDTQLTLGWGLFAFAGSVVVSMIASVLVGQLETRVRASGPGGADMCISGPGAVP